MRSEKPLEPSGILVEMSPMAADGQEVGNLQLQARPRTLRGRYRCKGNRRPARRPHLPRDQRPWAAGRKHQVVPVQDCHA